MYIYKFTKTTYNTPTGDLEDKYDLHTNKPKYFSSRRKAEEICKRWGKRLLDRLDSTLVKEEGDINLKDSDTYRVVYLDSEASFKEYGYYYVTILEIEKIEVL